MKQIAFIITFACIFSLGYGQRKIKKIEVLEKGFNVKLNYKPLENEMSQNGLKFNITPISPDALNSFFIKGNTYNGKFEYSHFEDSRVSYFLKKKRKRKREKSDYEFFIEGADWLIENERINKQEYDELVKQIIFYYDEELGDEVYSLNKVIISNPYYFDGKYLNVFKIEISNTTNSYKMFSDEITIESGNQTLKALTEDEIIDFLKDGKLFNNYKKRSLKRHHLPQSLSIPSNSKFEKYIAILPINYQNNLLLVSFSGNESKFKWEIEKDEVIIDELYTFYEFNVKYKFSDFSSESEANFNLLKSTESTIFIDDDLLFIEENHLSNEFEIFTLSLYSKKLHFGRNSGKGIDLLNFEKNRRNSFNIEFSKIEELKKKVKQER